MMFPKIKTYRDKKKREKVKKDYCEYCLRSVDTHIHHVKSRGSGGSDTEDNLVNLCIHCHDKAHRALISKNRLREIIGERG